MSIHTRRATAFDLDAIEGIYDRIHDECEQGRATVGWIRGVYPTRATAQAALERHNLCLQQKVPLQHQLVVPLRVRALHGRRALCRKGLR